MGAVRNTPAQRSFDATRRLNTTRRFTDVSPRTDYRDGRSSDWDRRVYNNRWAARTPVNFGPERRWARPFNYHWGDRINILPPRAHVCDFGGSRYWLDRRVVYGYGPSGYYVARPPIGLTLPWLPSGYTVYDFGGAPYYYYHNVWYRPVAGLNLNFSLNDGGGYENYVADQSDAVYDDDTPRFEVVQVPIGGMLEELPTPCETVVIDGQQYYQAGDLYFVQVMDGGRVMYLRVDPSQR